MLRKNKFLITNYSYKYNIMSFVSTRFNRLTFLYYFQRYFFFFKFFKKVYLNYFLQNFYLYKFILNYHHSNLHFVKPLTLTLSNTLEIPLYLKFFKNYILMQNFNVENNIGALLLFFNFSKTYKNNFIVKQVNEVGYQHYTFNEVYYSFFKKFFYILFLNLIFIKSIKLN